MLDAAGASRGAGTAEWNRGAYLVTAVGHCGECHTPRNFLGGLEESKRFSGNPNGVDGADVPNITPDKKSGIGRETHKMMLYHYPQTKNLLVSYSPQKPGFF